MRADGLDEALTRLIRDAEPLPRRALPFPLPQVMDAAARGGEPDRVSGIAADGKTRTLTVELEDGTDLTVDWPPMGEPRVRNRQTVPVETARWQLAVAERYWRYWPVAVEAAPRTVAAVLDGQPVEVAAGEPTLELLDVRWPVLPWPHGTLVFATSDETSAGRRISVSERSGQSSRTLGDVVSGRSISLQVAPGVQLAEQDQEHVLALAVRDHLQRWLELTILSRVIDSVLGKERHD